MKKEIIDTNQIAALIDKAKEVEAVKEKNSNKITQSSKKIHSQLVYLIRRGCTEGTNFWLLEYTFGLPYDEDLLVRIKLKLKQDGTIMKSEILDHERMNRPGQNFIKF